jgi:hypothetical protein
MEINIKDKRLINSRLIMRFRDQAKVFDKHIAIYSDLKGKPFASYQIEKHPITKEEAVIMKSKDNIAQLIISSQNTTLMYNYHPTYQLNAIASLALFTDMGESVFHSIIDIVKDISDIEVLGCINYIHIPTPSLNPAQMLFEQFINIPSIDKIHTLNLNFSVEENNEYFVNYSFTKYEQKVLAEKPANPVRPTQEELERAVKTGEGIQLIIDINNKPFLSTNAQDFDKFSVTKLLIFVRESILNIDKMFSNK